MVSCISPQGAAPAYPYRTKLRSVTAKCSWHPDTCSTSQSAGGMVSAVICTPRSCRSRIMDSAPAAGSFPPENRQTHDESRQRLPGFIVCLYQFGSKGRRALDNALVKCPEHRLRHRDIHHIPGHVRKLPACQHRVCESRAQDKRRGRRRHLVDCFTISPSEK